MRRYVVLASIAVVVAALAFVVWRDPSSTERTDPRAGGPSATERFFAEYVDADGRVVRHDQGGDTVSEGQSYAMQLALGNGDAASYGSAWLALGQQLLDGRNGQGNVIGRSKSLRLIKADTRVPAQVPPSTTAPPITEPPPTTTAPPSSTTTNTSATTTAPSPTTVASPPSVPATAAPPGAAAVVTTAVPTTDADGALGTVDPTDTDQTDSTEATDASTGSEQPASESADTTADDLTAPPSRLDPVLPGAHSSRVSPQSPAERSRRRTGGVTIVGFAGIASMGAALGLRERRFVRTRSPQNRPGG
jgi:hypothetical protein